MHKRKFRPAKVSARKRRRQISPGDHSSSSVKMCPEHDRFWRCRPITGDLGQVGGDSGQHLAISADLGRFRPVFGRCRPMLSDCWPGLCRLWPMLSEFGTFRASSTEFGAISAALCPKCPDSDACYVSDSNFDRSRSVSIWAGQKLSRRASSCPPLEPPRALRRVSSSSAPPTPVRHNLRCCSGPPRLVYTVVVGACLPRCGPLERGSRRCRVACEDLRVRSGSPRSGRSTLPQRFSSCPRSACLGYVGQLASTFSVTVASRTQTSAKNWRKGWPKLGHLWSKFGPDLAELPDDHSSGLQGDSGRPPDRPSTENCRSCFFGGSQGVGPMLVDIWQGLADVAGGS